MPDRMLQNKLRNILAENLTPAAKSSSIAEAIWLAGIYPWVGIYDVDVRPVWSQILHGADRRAGVPCFSITQGITSRAVAERKTINEGDAASNSGYLTALESTRSEIIVPVLDDAAAVIGTIDVESERLKSALPAATGAEPYLAKACSRAAAE